MSWQDYPPNGTISLDPEHGYVWTTDCRKCGTTQRIRIGHLTVDDARAALGKCAHDVRECPGGFHVELGGWDQLWSFDLLLEQYQAVLEGAAQPQAA